MPYVDVALTGPSSMVPALRQPLPEPGVGPGQLSSRLKSAADARWYETCGEQSQGHSQVLLQRVPQEAWCALDRGACRHQTPSWGDVVVPVAAALHWPVTGSR